MHDIVEKLTKENGNLKRQLGIQGYKRSKRKTKPKLIIRSREIEDEVILKRGNQRLQRKVWIWRSIMDNYWQIAAHVLWIPKSISSSKVYIFECLAKDSKLSASWEATQANLHQFFSCLLCFFIFCIREISEDKHESEISKQKVKCVRRSKGT